jgi:predicted nucleic acid-binding protein
MSGRFFIDTNIFVYSLETADLKKLRISGDLITDAVKSGSGVVSYQVVQDFLHLALRRFVNPMTVMEAERYLNVVLRPLLSIHSSPMLFAEALHLHGRYQLAWYDSLIVAAAMQANCDVLYSEDLQNGQRFGKLQVKNPFI